MNFILYNYATKIEKEIVIMNLDEFYRRNIKADYDRKST